MTDFLPLKWYSPEDIDGIWNDLQKQKAALLAQGTNAWNRSDLRGFEVSFFQTFPSRRSPDPDPNASLPRLTVNRYWSGRNVDEPDPDVEVGYGYTVERSAILQLQPSPDGSGVWGLLWRF